MVRSFLFALMLATATFAQSAKVDLSWMAGVWTGEQWGGMNTETWTAPDAAGTMFGAYRFVKEGKPVFYELMAVEMQDGKPVLLLRHFNRGLVAWEEREGALRFTVEQKGEREVVFEERSAPEKKTTLRYRQESPDSLNVELVRVRNGKTDSERFSFRRVN